ncbi:transposase-like protein [Roseateles terrae]|uniref:Transposase-like protein n=1 Tax=Roseateles terrae TaxID=431060 RepID=A0ABR6GUQ2_9BURK|nr:transposase-like protein [Roseateles terrae]
MDEEIKRWTAKRKTAFVREIIQGKTSVSEASRAQGRRTASAELHEALATGSVACCCPCS